jgi:hypothetical protein
MALLTDQILASGVTLNDFVHVVITGDTSQNPAGSSFKATIQQVANAIGVSGFSGGTVPFATNFTNGLSANTFSATTYLNLPNTTGAYLPLSGGTITGSTTQMVFNPNVNSSQLNVSGTTGLPMLQASIAPYLSSSSASIQIGMRTWNQVGNPGYGKVGDGFVYASNETNGLNIINRQGTGTEDYVRIYAGQDANSTIPDIHVQGSGSTRGYVGFGTTTPIEKVDVAGNIKASGNLIIGTVGTSSPLYVLGIDSNGVVVSGATGVSGTSGSSGSSGTTGSSGSSGSSGTTGSSGSSGSSGTGFNTVQDPALSRVLTSDGTSNGAIAQSGLTFSANQLTISGLTYTSGITSTSKITFPQLTINSGYTVTDNDYMVDITGGTFTVNLPSAIGRQGRLLVIKNNGGGAVTVLPNGGENIDDKSFVILGETNSIQLASNGANWIAISYNISTVNSSTGVFEFTGLTIASPTTFTVAPVKGWIVDDNTNPLSPQLYYIAYTGGTFTATYVTTSTETWIFLTSGGTITQLNIPPTETERRQNIFLGKLGHANKTSIINAFSQPDFVQSPLAQLRDMFTPINLINGGVRPSPNGVNLSFNTSANYIYGLGINFATNPLQPDALFVSGTAPCTFQYRTQTGGTATNTTTIDPTVYDVGGVVTPLSGTKATNQRIYLVQNGVFRVQYGQQFYSTLAQAVAGIATEQYVEFSNFTTNGILIGVLSVLSTCTDLSDQSKALFFNVSKFGDATGAAGGTPTTNLQQAYDNSVQPEITTNATLGAFSVKNGTGNPDATTNLFEGIDSTNGLTSVITARGTITGTSITTTGSVTGATLIGNVITGTTISANTVNSPNIIVVSATTGTSVSYLGIDSNNKIIKATVPGSDNQLLTSDGSGGITSESTLTYDGSTLRLLYQSGDEGGEMLISKPVTNTSISGTGVSIDVYQNKYRIFEQGGSARGGYIDITDLDTSVGVNLAPWRYLYVTRATSNQTIGSGTWANIDIIFNNQVVAKGISYNTGSGVATLSPGVYRITAQLAWQAAAVYTIQFSCYDSSNNQLGPTVEMIQSTNTTNNISNGYLDFIYTATNTIGVKIKTTNTTNALTGEQIRSDLNTAMIIQQIG